jgi:mannose-1-phosphate guanylyltransferase
MGTAGAIKNAAGYLDETFLALNGDIFTDLDITDMIAFHRERKARATISLALVDDPTSYGLIETDARCRITRFREKPKPEEVTTNLINAGTYVLEPDVLAQIPPERAVSIERETFQQLLAQDEPMYAYSSSAYWLDMGTPEKYLQLHRDLLGGKCRNCVLAPTEKVAIGERSSIHSTARIKGPVVIGANCSIGRGVKLTGPVVIGDGGAILEGSVIEDSVIWRNARLGPRANVKGSILAENCCLEEGSVCQDSVLGDNVTVVSYGKVKPGSRVEPGTVVDA